MKTYEHQLRITWKGNFPIDMLRHDAAYPQTGTDASAIQQSFQPSRKEHTAVIITHSRYAKSNWTHERWHSFLCTTEELMTYVCT